MQEVEEEIILNGSYEKLQKKEATLQKQLDEHSAQEETLWCQKYRVQWLREEEKIQNSSTKL